MSVCLPACQSVCLSACRYGWKEGRMDGWMDGGMEGWRDGGIFFCSCLCTCARQPYRALKSDLLNFATSSFPICLCPVLVLGWSTCLQNHMRQSSEHTVDTLSPVQVLFNLLHFHLTCNYLLLPAPCISLGLILFIAALPVKILKQTAMLTYALCLMRSQFLCS